MRQVRTGILVLAAILFTAASAHAQPGVTTFNSSANVNVLRPYGFNVGGQPTLLVSLPSTINYVQPAGTLARSGSTNDASGTNDQWNGLFASGGSATVTFTLPGKVTVGSYSVELTTLLPGTFEMDGLVSGVWTPLVVNNSPVSGITTGTFTPKLVTQLRYIVTGQTGSTFTQVQQLKVFRKAGQTVGYYGGYDFLHDLGATAVVGTTGGSWTATTGNTAASIVDADFQTQINMQTLPSSPSSTGGGHTFVILKLNSPEFMNAIHLGFFNGQMWSNGYAIYTAAAGTFPSLGTTLTAGTAAGVTEGLTISSNDITTPNDSIFTGAGWTYQFSSTAATGFDKIVGLGTPGTYQYVLIAWNGTQGALADVEIFAIPEPASLIVLSMGALPLLARRRRV